MRLFVALPVPADVRRVLSDLRDPSFSDVRWIPPERYHVTLCFLGASSPDDASRYAEALRTMSAPPARCATYGLDVLPGRRRPRVLIAGLDRTPSLMRVHAAVNDALEPVGASPDDRPFRPHVTLGRVQSSVDPAALHRTLRAHEEFDAPTFTVSAVHLYESIPIDGGVRYESRASVPLFDNGTTTD